MNVALWAEIRRLHEIEKLSARAIARRVNSSRCTVARALRLDQPPTDRRAPRPGILAPFQAKVDALLARYPNLSAVRIHEEISKPPEGYSGSVIVVRRYLRKVRPARGRIYQEVHYEPAQAMQIDWGECGRVAVGGTSRKVSVLVATLCYSRTTYIEFSLSQHKAEFYRLLVNALTFFRGSPRAIIFDNLKAAVLNGSGRQACFHPDFLALCGYFCMQPIACERRDPESKGIVEGGVRYVKRNALAGRDDELLTFADYAALASRWRDDVANVRIHETTPVKHDGVSLPLMSGGETNEPYDLGTLRCQLDDKSPMIDRTCGQLGNEKGDPAKDAVERTTIFFLRFADAKSALATMKAEAASREILGFEATIDPRQNSVAITADTDTLKLLQEILNRLDSPN